MWGFSFPTRDWTCVPYIARQTLKHRTTREISKIFCLLSLFLFSLSFEDIFLLLLCFHQYPLSFFCSYDDSLLVAFSFFSSSSFLSTTNSFSITLVFLFHPWVCVPAISSWFIGTVSILQFFEPRDNCMTFLWFTATLLHCVLFIFLLCIIYLPFLPPCLHLSLCVTCN